MAKHRILVVDDEPLNLEIISAFLADEPFELELFDDSLAAWDRVMSCDKHDKPFHLVLLDNMMPGLNGMEFLSRLKREPRFKLLPVVMQTAASSQADIAKGLSAGAYYYLTKPYEPQILVSIVRAALSDINDHQQLREQLLSVRSGLGLIQESRFSFKTIQEISHLVTLISLMADNPEAAAMGLTELFCNAIEHGNLGVTYAEKSLLKLRNGWEAEIHRRQGLTENQNKSVQVRIWREGDQIGIHIADQGQGFNWQDYLEISPDRAFDPNGRGIALARKLSFTALSYQGCGNEVTAYLTAHA